MKQFLRGTGTKLNMVDFLKGLSFLILPLGLGSKRLDFFENKIKEYSGKVRDKSKPTHVIIDESVGENREKCLMALKTNELVLSGDFQVVGTKWLSKCFAERRLVDAKEFQFSWIKNEAGAAGNQDDGTEEQCSRVSGGELQELSPKKKMKIEVEEITSDQSSLPKNELSSKKKLIIDELQKLADAFTARKDTWRAYSYEKAISAILRYDKDFTTYQEACKIPGIGERTALKIMEILESGKLRKVEDILDEKTKILESFCNIWGVGPSTAECWYLQGYRSLQELKEKGKLSKQQDIGLKYYEDFMRRMTREEVERIGAVVAEEIKHVQGHCRTVLVGSYRRGKATCGDVDIMLVNPGPKYACDILMQLTDSLRSKNYLTDDLVTLDDTASSDESSHRKYMGVFKFPGDSEVHRRIDIFVVPEAEYAAGLMHYTGSALFNRSIRLFASKKGLTLNEHGLYSGIIRKGSGILNNGELVPTPTEKDIFNHLGLEYKLPEERDH